MGAKQIVGGIMAICFLSTAYLEDPLPIIDEVVSMLVAWGWNRKAAIGVAFTIVGLTFLLKAPPKGLLK